MWKAIWVVLCSFFFSLNVFYGQAFINLFYSSSPLFQFPGKKPLVGRNVREISVSVPFFPCVNALPSKSTASLCIYCVRRWVLSFFPLFHGWNLSAFLRAESEMVMDCWCATSERLNERTHWERENLNASVRCRKGTWWLWEEPVWASVNRQRVFFFFCRTIRRTFIYILPSLLFCLPSSLSYIAIIFKELHLKKKKITPKKAICSGMFKWSTKYVFLLNLMWMVCVLSRCYWTHLCERDVMLSVGGALGVGGEWGWAWALSGLTGVMYWWWKRRMLQEVSFVMCFECFLYVLWI